MEYTDIHSHVLPGVDDGAADITETLAMLKEAYGQGIRTIFATPHYIPGRKKKSAEELRRIHAEVCEAAKENMPDLKIFLGNEIYCKEGVLNSILEGRALTLADTKYVLLEFSTSISYKELFGYIKAISGKHYRPIIAHAERYGCLYRKEELIRELIDAGAYIQMNTESLPGGSFNRQAAYCRSLLEKGYVHFLGTDCHDMQMRKPQMQTDLSKIKYARYEEQIKKIMLHNVDCLYRRDHRVK